MTFQQLGEQVMKPVPLGFVIQSNEKEVVTLELGNDTVTRSTHDVSYKVCGKTFENGQAQELPSQRFRKPVEYISEQIVKDVLITFCESQNCGFLVASTFE
ncbi:MAG: hypothetical protein MUC47_10125 [Candidatus Kapabacteria bacterium]|nr:hypothetical protein [Candidatus Kapabacteria bacterium]